MLASGTGQKRLVSNGARPSWSPFVSTRNLVGTGGALAESASGFLYGRRGDVTTSLLVFDTVTPAGARITAQTPAGLNAPNFVFEVTAADAIRSLSFQNDFYQRRIMVIDPATSLVPTVTGALVDFNASTGKVSSVLPYVANRADGSADRGPVRRGGALIFYRTFLSVWDGTGHNLAPHGATEARFDSRSGRLLSVH